MYDCDGVEALKFFTAAVYDVWHAADIYAECNSVWALWMERWFSYLFFNGAFFLIQRKLPGKSVRARHILTTPTIDASLGIGDAAGIMTGKTVTGPVVVVVAGTTVVDNCAMAKAAR